MKALSIHQPWADLICLPATDGRHKRIENRTWSTNHRGPLVIHASCSQEHLKAVPEYRVAPGRFGVIVAIADVVEVLEMPRIALLAHGGGLGDEPKWTARPNFPFPERFQWVLDHRWTEGPFCWVLENVRLVKPVKIAGQRRLFEVPDGMILSLNCM